MRTSAVTVGVVTVPAGWRGSVAWLPEGWAVIGTGGNCTALSRETPELVAFVVSVAHEWTAPTRPDEPVTLGLWDGRDEAVTEHATAAEAVRYADAAILAAVVPTFGLAYQHDNP